MKIDKQILISKVKILSIFVLFIIIFQYKNHYQNLNFKRNNKNDYLFLEIKKIFPNASTINKKKEASDFNIVFNEKKEIIGKYLFSSPYSDHIKGHGGSVSILIAMKPDNIIKKIKILKNDETKIYMDWIFAQGFLDLWQGLNFKEIVSHKIDALSGATISTNAIINIIKHRSSLVNKSEFETQSKLFSIFDVLIILISIIAVFFMFNPIFYKKYRTLFLFTRVILLGFICGKYISIVILLNFIKSASFFVFGIGGLFLVIISFVFAFILNRRFYCNYLCPFGAMQDIVLIFVKKWVKTSVLYLKMKNKIKYAGHLYFAVILMSIIFFDKVNLENFEPFSIFQLKIVSIWIILFSIVLLIVSVWIPRFWCRFFCPTGKIFNFLYRKTKEIGEKT